MPVICMKASVPNRADNVHLGLDKPELARSYCEPPDRPPATRQI
jgi:hypothetical protein